MPNKDRLQMIQAIITRLAANSGALKGFAVPVVTALLGVAISQKNKDYAWLGIYPVVVFGLLDAYYLALERSFRKLYDAAVLEDADKWGLTPGKLGWGVIHALFSPSIWGFYLAALAAVIAVALIL
jgi:hypothetical protein